MVGTLSGVGNSVGAAAQKAKKPALIGTAAAAGIAGSMALGSKMLSRPRKVAGVPVRRPRVPMPGRSGALKAVVGEAQQVGKEIGKAGFRLGVGDVSMEVKSGSKEHRDSPLEVLLHGLTARREKRR